MSTDYTHFTKLSFDQLFARKGPGEEVQVMDSEGNLSVAGLTLTGSLNVNSLTAATTIAATGNITGANLSGTNTGDQTSVSGNAGTATALQTPRAINGVTFSGTAAITVTAAAGTLTGATLAAGVTASSLTSVGTLASLTVTNPIAGSVTGSAATATTAGNVTGIVAIANGGTNSTAALNNNRLIQSLSGKLQEASAITASRTLISDSNGIPTHSTVTGTQLANAIGTCSAKSADYTITDTDGFNTILMTTSTTNRVVTLPTASTNSGRVLTVKKVDSATGKCTVTGTIDGVSNFILVDQDDYVEVQSDGTNWIIISKGIGTRAPSRIRDEVGAGHGSTNTKIRRIETNVYNTGNAISRATSATAGNSYTINQNGWFAISYSDRSSAGSCEVGYSKNSAQLTTSLDAITNTTRLQYSSTNTANNCAYTSSVEYLVVGDVVRPHTDASPNITAVDCNFQITKIGI